MQRYHPSNYIPLVGMVLIIPTVIIGAALIGGLFFVVDDYIYIPILFPALMGTLSGGVLAIPVYVGKIRNPLVMAIIGIVLACVSYGAYFYIDYQFGFRHDLRNEIEADFGYSITDQRLKIYEDQFLQHEVGSTGFRGYLEFSAKAGIYFESSTTPWVANDNPDLQGTSVYIYWLVELVFAAAMGFVIGRMVPNMPFSEQTNQWFGEEKKVGIVPPNYVGQLIQALEHGNFAQAGRIAHSQTDLPNVQFELIVRKTRSPEADLFLSVRKLTQNRHEMLFGGLISPVDFATLKANIR